MALIATSPIVTLELPTAISAGRRAFVRQWRVGKGSKPAEATIILPDTAAQDVAWSDGQAVTIYQDADCVFRGHVYVVPQELDGGSSDVMLTAHDVRRAMTRRPIGQYGIGPNSPTGGWPGIGYDLVFNPDGKPNRSAAVDSTAGYTYTFDTTSAAQFWTYAQVLQMLYYWYVDSDVCRVNMALLSTPLDSAAPMIVANVGDPATVTDQIFKLLGGTWTVKHSGDIGGTSYSELSPVMAGVTAGNSHTVYVSTATDQATPGRYHAAKIKTERSTLNSFDRVEVHSGAVVVEHTYYNTTHSAVNPLLTRVSVASDLPAGDVCYFKVDTSKYSAHSLGGNLGAGSRPKPWDSKLITRRTDSGYIAAGFDFLDGEEIPCKETLWLTIDGGTKWYRAKGGVRIDLKLCRVYVEETITVHGGRSGATIKRRIRDASQVGIRFTVATVVNDVNEVRYVASSYLTATRTRRLLRRDLSPAYRLVSRLPDLTSSNPNDSTLYAATLELYNSVTSQLETLALEHWRTRQEAEISARFELPFMGRLDIGDAITFAPAALGLGTLRVTDVSYNAESKSASIGATNNLDFAK